MKVLLILLALAKIILNDEDELSTDGPDAPAA